ncbi:MAG: tetratricopeptide repeat protein [Planctomycetes bacterium]|nr:tetratricopeptide repeat protein [Planctomycetota bacterium]
MSARWQRVRETFEQICDLDASERKAKLAVVEQEDPTLCADVASLLVSYDEGATALDFLPELCSSDVPPQGTDVERIGQMVGAYRLIERLAVGGMSTVYLAERADTQTGDRVAIKIITSAGPLPQRARKRFYHERRLLAELNHPNIARLLHGGVTDDGWPYLVMEYVAGEPIDVYCEAHDLSIEGRVAVFRGVCAAVQYAHQNLVVHRDLKPGNILVTRDGVPKLLDFGIAKLLQPEYTPQSAAAPTTERFMTPEYASPEQIRGMGVTTASDVYSLGVILYQLLTGRRPHSFKTRLVYEIARIICDEDPLKPSLAVSQATSSYDHSESNRHGVPSEKEDRPSKARRDKLGHRLAGDMDAIVMRAMRKEPDSRYSSVDQFADDLGRYLQGMPVRARKGTWRYRASKFIRRNRTGVAALSAVFVVLVACVVTSTWFAIQAKRQAAIAQAVNDFLNDDFLAAVALEFQGKDVSMRVVLDAASKAIAGKFEDEPLIEAAVRTTVGTTYASLGVFEAALPHLERALVLTRAELGEDQAGTLTAMIDLAKLYGQQGRYDEAEPMHVEALTASRRVLGEDHPVTLKSMSKLAQLYLGLARYEEAERLLVKTLEANHRVLGEDHRDTLHTMTNLAEVFVRQGRYDEAEPLSLRALEVSQRVLGPEHPKTLGFMNNLAELYSHQGRYDDAEPLHVKALDGGLRVRGEEHPDTLTSMNNLALLYVRQGRYDQAEPLYHRALEAYRRVLGEDHPHTLASMGSLSELYRKQARYDEAEPLSIKAMETNLRVLGEEHPSTLGSMNNLAVLYFDQGRYDEAEPLQLRVLEVSRRILGEDHPNTLGSVSNLAKLYRNQGRYDEAEPLYTKLLEGCRRVLGEEHPYTLKSMCYLGQSYASQARYAEAEPLYLAALEVQDRVLGKDHPDTLTTMSYLAGLYTAQARYDEAERLCVQALDGCRNVLGDDHPTTLETEGNLAILLGQKGETERAERMFQGVLELQLAKLGPDHPNVLTTTENLAEFLHKRGRLNEAESLYRTALEVLRRTGRQESDRAQLIRHNLSAVLNELQK